MININSKESTKNPNGIDGNSNEIIKLKRCPICLCEVIKRCKNPMACGLQKMKAIFDLF